MPQRNVKCVGRHGTRRIQATTGQPSDTVIWVQDVCSPHCLFACCATLPGGCCKVMAFSWRTAAYGVRFLSTSTKPSSPADDRGLGFFVLLRVNPRHVTWFHIVLCGFALLYRKFPSNGVATVPTITTRTAYLNSSHGRARGARTRRLGGSTIPL